MLNQNQWVNGQPEPIHLQLQSAMFYPNAYLNFNQNGEYTKHYYNGAERVCSRLGEHPVSISTNTNDLLGFRIMQADQQARADLLELVEAGDVPIETPSVDVTVLQPTGTASDIFYYHMNHLGSTAFVTDQNQNVTQGFLYAPFGEITTEYAPSWQNGTLPKYSFNAKELDEETGMYYYEARYYKPPVFTSRDPMFEKYFWMTPYAYCANNPVKYVDPSGEEIDDDIIIQGKNNSSITIKTDLLNLELSVNKDFGGNYTLKPDNVAIGYEYGVDAAGKAVVGTSYTAYKQSVMFLSGSYAGYWYDYFGGEAQMDVSTSVEGAVGIHKNFFIAINNNSTTYNPQDFAGEYYGATLSASWKALGGISIDCQKAVSKDNTWTMISLGASVSIGAQVNLFAGFGASAGAHIGGTKLLGKPKKTSQRSCFDILSNWYLHLFY